MCMPILRPVCRNLPTRPRRIDINDLLLTGIQRAALFDELSAHVKTSSRNIAADMSGKRLLSS